MDPAGAARPERHGEDGERAMAQVKPGRTQLWAMTHEQRDRVAEMLGALPDDQWDTPSLCSAWRVRDVVGHCIETQLMTPARFMGRFAGTGFRFHAMNAKGVGMHKGDSPSQLRDEYRNSAHRTTAAPGPTVTWLAEAVIHGEDMARPTSKRLDVAPAALVAVADFVRNSTPILHGKQRSSGLRLRATDVDWTAGDGPEVSGPAASLILAMTGRSAALADLSGEGVDALASRMP
jgi:uncharacterized protein (TIGR03083 family)